MENRLLPINGVKEAEMTPLLPQEQDATTLFQTISNIVKAVLGVGLLNIPFAFRSCGWIYFAELAIIAVITNYTAIILWNMLDKHIKEQQNWSYSQLGYVAFGKAGKWIVSAIVFPQQFFVCSLFLVLTAQCLEVVVQTPQLTVQRAIIICTLAEIPVVMFRKYTRLAFLSFGGLIAVFWIFATIVCLFFLDLPKPISGALVEDPKKLPVGIGVAIFAFGGHYMFPPFYSKMQDKTKIPTAIHLSWFVIFLACCIFGFTGFYLYGEDTKENIAQNLPSSIYSDLVTSAIGINTLFTYPLVLNPMATTIEEKFFSMNFNVPKLLITVFVRLTLLCFTFVVAYLLPYFGSLMAFIGVVFDNSTALLLPAIMNIRLMDLSPATKILNIVILCFGLCCTVLGVMLSFQDIH
mmetsp:Transcript_23458/g.32796  ORF Transcript_23458/g.32796 Transcript_23458/m.32796 type:complete len:407 (-) Transcript_23458:1169-2389(-)